MVAPIVKDILDKVVTEPTRKAPLIQQLPLSTGVVEAELMNMAGLGEVVVIMVPEGPIYLTREHAKFFFGLVEPT